MALGFEQEIKVFMIFDVLGDMERTGPKIWQVNRKRLEDIKDHVFDLQIMYKLIKNKLPIKLDDEKMEDYFYFHDLPEAITGDITKFEGVSSEEKRRVTTKAIDYLAELFRGLFDVSSIIYGFEDQTDLEAKIAKMFDSIHSSTTFMKYQSEQNIDGNNPNLIPALRYNAFVANELASGKDVADIFFDFHYQALAISDEECLRYGISREIADRIVEVMRVFMQTFYSHKLGGTLLVNSSEFPQDATIYNSYINEKR